MKRILHRLRTLIEEYIIGSKWRKKKYAPPYYDMDPSCALRRGARSCVCLCAVHFHINISDTVETPIFFPRTSTVCTIHCRMCVRIVSFKTFAVKRLASNLLSIRTENSIGNLNVPDECETEIERRTSEKCEKMRRTVKVCATFDSCAHKNFIGDECDESEKLSTIRPTTGPSAPFVQAMKKC